MDQLDLFADDTVRARRARIALDRFELATAREELTRLLQIYPDDRHRHDSLERTTRLERRLTELERAGDQLSALLALEPDVQAPERAAWHARVAREAEARLGKGCKIVDVPVGLHWLQAGKIDEAEQALVATLECDPHDARARGYLADVQYLKGDLDRARREYLRAFLDDSLSVDVARILDARVTDLLARAELEYEATGDPRTWTAAIGVVEKVFPVPAPALPGVLDDKTFRTSSGAQFYWLIVRERAAKSHDERVATRRRMKQLCPALFDAYLREMY
jgi:tetratricopeptide (TPR) repeat protein